MRTALLAAAALPHSLRNAVAPPPRAHAPTRTHTRAHPAAPNSREEFQAILEEEELRDAAVLVYANKQVRARVFACVCV